MLPDATVTAHLAPLRPAPLTDADCMRGLVAPWTHIARAYGTDDAYYVINRDPVRRASLSKAEAAIGTLTAEDWATPPGQTCAARLFGERRAYLLPQLWRLADAAPYRATHQQRAFRLADGTPNPSKRTELVRGLAHYHREGLSQMSLAHMARYETYRSADSFASGALYAVALGAGDEVRPVHGAHSADGPGGPNEPDSDVIDVITDIVHNEDDVGKLTRGHLIGLLLSPDPAHWHLVTKLLLAAQREEGLRQTILEVADQARADALLHLTEVILEHKLTRFASVVRAFDVWFGTGWEAERESVVRRGLEILLAAARDEEARRKFCGSANHLEVYMGLCALALTDARAAGREIVTLIDGPERGTRLTVAYLHQVLFLNNPELGSKLAARLGEDPCLDALALPLLYRTYALSPADVDRLFALADSTPKDGIECTDAPFSWLSPKLTRDAVHAALLEHADEAILERLADYLPQLSVYTREQYFRRVVLGGEYFYLRSDNAAARYEEGARRVADVPWRRALVFRGLTDRSSDIPVIALNVARRLALAGAEVQEITALLKRKGKAMRARLIETVAALPEPTLTTALDQLLAAKTAQQRLAGLEVMATLQEGERLPAVVNARVRAYRERPRLSKVEQDYLERFAIGGDGGDGDGGDGDGGDGEALPPGLATGFGAIDPAALPVIKIEPRLDALAERAGESSGGLLSRVKRKFTRAAGPYAGLIDGAKVMTALMQLATRFEEHATHEYRTDYNSSTPGRAVLLGGSLVPLSPYEVHRAMPPRERLDDLPLSEVWKAWYDAAALNVYELAYLQWLVGRPYYLIRDVDELQRAVNAFYPERGELPAELIARDGYRLRYPVAEVAAPYFDAYADRDILGPLAADELEHAVATFPTELFADREDYRTTNHWSNLPGRLLGSLCPPSPKRHPEAALRYQRLRAALQIADDLKLARPGGVLAKALTTQNEDRYRNDTLLHTALQLYAAGHVDINEARLPLALDFRAVAFARWRDKPNSRAEAEIQRVIPEVIQPFADGVVALELTRGERPTEATGYVQYVYETGGARVLTEAVAKIDGGFARASYRDNGSKTSSLRHIIQHTSIRPEDTLAAFLEQARSAEVPEERWLLVAMFAPQWAEWIGELLGISGLHSAVWWFRAHTQSYSIDATHETVVARYSPADANSLTEGGVDVAWFRSAYEGVGRKTWKALQDAAQYAGEGSGHRQVKLYSQIMLGEKKLTEVRKRVTEKRDKDYLRGLGLVPLARKKPLADALRRYELIEDFRKTSKQFGAQRQASERAAADTAVENLARNAGFEDVTRFVWSMEAAVSERLLRDAVVTLETASAKTAPAPVTVELYVDELGRAQTHVRRGDKDLKAVPAKLRKDPRVQDLQERKRALTDQYRRTRLSLELAMASGGTFRGEELRGLAEHPVVAPMLRNLVFYRVAAEASGLYAGTHPGEVHLRDVHGARVAFADDDELLLAHPTHLCGSVTWDQWQRYAFEHELRQPFKQLFRELYLVTADERELGTESKRYQGHQVQPRKTVALLRARGWTANYGEGLQRVYHAAGLVATVYAEADWMTPGDVESPVLEQVVFYDAATMYQPLRLDEVPPVLFSEVMRDLDLVVSVAHVGHVDPEASHSTMEMRAALVRETARLFGLDNVEVKERHAIVRGEFGTYSLHLGSGQVSKAQLALSIKAVQSQQRGRVFLPFVDDDPKSAEIVSKTVLLARDGEVRDPELVRVLRT